MLADMDPFERGLLETLPPGVHFRPYPAEVTCLVMLWEYVHLDIAGIY
jgi:hypothetical protein